MSGQELSDRVRRSLFLLKDKIGRRPAEWDRYKTACNPYELVYMAPPCVPCGDGFRSPVSRAFYKLWEIMHSADGVKRVLSDPSPKRFAYLAEAPGSFVEAVVTRRRDMYRRGKMDTHVGITLSSERRSTPGWKIPRSWMRAYNVSLCSGRDGSGDITRRKVIDDMVEACGGRGACDMVTGDGGFDFSSDFNEQESMMRKLLAAEILAAIRLLKPGGCCVLKVFDAYSADTKSLLGGLLDCFEGRELRKPKTSRPANSERYAVCWGFRGAPDWLDAGLESYLEGGSLPPVVAGCLGYIEEENLRHGLAQIECILGVMDVMDRGGARCGDLSGEWIGEYMPGGVSSRTGGRTRALSPRGC